MILTRRKALALAAAAPASALFAALASFITPARAYQARLILVKKRPPAPDFAIRGLDGKLYALKDFRGKVLLLNFWATWCPPCRREMPSIEALWRDVQGRNIAVAGVHVGPSAGAARQYAESNGLTFPILVDSDRDISAHYGVRSMPTTVIIGPDGHVDYVAFGPRDWNSADTLKVLKALAAGKPVKT